MITTTRTQHGYTVSTWPDGHFVPDAWDAYRLACLATWLGGTGYALSDARAMLREGPATVRSAWREIGAKVTGRAGEWAW